jgi:hypothetical protein
MKTVFKIETPVGDGQMMDNGYISIVGTSPNFIPYVSISPAGGDESGYFIKDKDLERFAVNILKALNSKHLNTKPKRK